MHLRRSKQFISLITQFNRLGFYSASCSNSFARHLQDQTAHKEYTPLITIED